MDKKINAPETKQPWAKMKMTPLGNVSDLLKNGGGKTSALAPDGPDVRKPPGK